MQNLTQRCNNVLLMENLLKNNLIFVKDVPTIYIYIYILLQLYLLLLS